MFDWIAANRVWLLVGVVTDAGAQAHGHGAMVMGEPAADEHLGDLPLPGRAAAAAAHRRAVRRHVKCS